MERIMLFEYRQSCLRKHRQELTGEYANGPLHLGHAPWRNEEGLEREYTQQQVIGMKTRFTVEQHREMASRLGSIRDDLVGLSVMIGNAYPIELSDGLGKAVRIIDKVRSNLEEEMLKENRGLGNEALKIYYGTRSRNKCSTEPEHDLNRTE